MAILAIVATMALCKINFLSPDSCASWSGVRDLCKLSIQHATTVFKQSALHSSWLLYKHAQWLVQLDLGHYTAHNIHIFQLRAFSKLWIPPGPIIKEVLLHIIVCKFYILISAYHTVQCTSALATQLLTYMYRL